MANICTFDPTRDEKWAVVTSFDECSADKSVIRIINLSEGVIARTLTLDGRMMSQCWDSPGLKMAFSLYDLGDSYSTQLVTLDTTRPDFDVRTLRLEDVSQICLTPSTWSPDSKILTFSVRLGGEPFRWLEITPGPTADDWRVRDTAGPIIRDFGSTENR